VTVVSAIQIGRSQTGPMFQRGFALPDPLEDGTCRSGACAPVAVREGAGPLQTEPARTATFVASAFALGQAFAARSSSAPRQHHSVATPAHRSGKTLHASQMAARSAGKIIYLTGERA
jgi:hypothetical protein